jgi:hypothetical protein
MSAARIATNFPWSSPAVKSGQAKFARMLDLAYSEEVEERGSDPAIGYRAGAAATQTGRGVGQGTGALKEPTRKDYVVGSGNVFADLGYARPEEVAAKAN